MKTINLKRNLNVLFLSLFCFFALSCSDNNDEFIDKTLFLGGWDILSIDGQDINCTESQTATFFNDGGIELYLLDGENCKFTLSNAKYNVVKDVLYLFRSDAVTIKANIVDINNEIMELDFFFVSDSPDRENEVWLLSKI